MAWFNLLFISWAVLFCSASAEIDRNIKDLPPFYRSYFPLKPDSGNLAQTGKIDSIHAIGAEKRESAIDNANKNVDPQTNKTQTAFSMMPIPKKLALYHRSVKNAVILPGLGVKSSFPELETVKSPSAYQEGTLDKHYFNDNPKDLQPHTYSSFQKRYNEILRYNMERQLAGSYGSTDRFLDPIWSQLRKPSYVPDEASKVVAERDEDYFKMLNRYPLQDTHQQSYYDKLNEDQLANQDIAYMAKDDAFDADQEEDSY